MEYTNRPCIYSLKDGQPCADHDRQTGEGIKPVAHKLFHDGNNFSIPSLAVAHDLACRIETDDGCEYQGKISKYLYDNISMQGIKITELSALSAFSALSAVSAHDTGITIWLPEAPVLSRTGDKCIVAIVPQWYLRYGDAEWIAETVKVIKSMIIHDDEVRKQLLIAAENMTNWCVSREYGLGTRLPHDPKFLIDSLSDSTIYMAYYTVCHLLHDDLYGDKGHRRDQIDDNFWNAVLLGQSYGGSVSADLIQQCRDEFTRYYPVALRVSGKDLIYNHLVMSIFNHIAIFGKDKCIKEYLINGHARINGAKMSKSTGNFITIAQAKTLYRTDALRVMLVESGDGLEDSNIRLEESDNVSEALDRYYELLKRIPASVQDLQELAHDLAHRLNMLRHKLIYYLQQSQRAFQRGRYREAITYGWRKCNKLLDAVDADGSLPADLIKLSVIIQNVTMSTILGHTPCYDIPDWVSTFNINMGLVEFYDFLKVIDTGINKAVHAGGSFNIKLHRQLESYTVIITEHLATRNITDVCYIYDETPLHPKRNAFKVKPKISYKDKATLNQSLEHIHV